ncbi:MAG TPA: glycosyltransferase family 39 protein [Bacteroidota bacterium]|nr:glycosyltransferase family 39 protein [Bacteroidota bacterium]
MKLWKSMWFVLGGIAFIGLYFAIASLQNYFQLVSLVYGGNVSAYMRWIPTQWMQAQLWKILLLLPATFLLTVAFVRSEIQIPFFHFRVNRKSIAAVLVVVLLLIILSVNFLFHATEITDDELVYDFQAKTLLAGRLVNPPPPVAASFENVFLINDGHVWVGKYTLGHPFIIALGMFLGSRYTITILESLLTLLLVYFIADELYQNKKLAFTALLLGALSPFFYFMSSTRLSHTTEAFCLALFFYLFLRARRTEALSWRFLLLLLAGFSAGYAFNVRSLTALGFLLPFAVVVVVRDIWKSPAKGIKDSLPLIIGFATVVAVTLWYNYLVTGNMLDFPFLYYSNVETVGFGTYGHTPMFGIQNFLVLCFRLNAALFGLPISLLFVFLFSFADKKFGDRLLLGILAGVAGSYYFYYSPGVSDIGPVYYYELIIPLFLLSARGIFYVKDVLAKHSEHAAKYVTTFFAISFLLAFVTYVPERMMHLARLTNNIREPYGAVQNANIHQALVLIQSYVPTGWVDGFRNPSPKFNDDIIFCQYADSVSNQKVVRYFHDRRPFILKYDTTQYHFVVEPLDTSISMLKGIQK